MYFNLESTDAGYAFPPALTDGAGLPGGGDSPLLREPPSTAALTLACPGLCPLYPGGTALTGAHSPGGALPGICCTCYEDRRAEVTRARAPPSPTLCGSVFVFC